MHTLYENDVFDISETHQVPPPPLSLFSTSSLHHLPHPYPLSPLPVTEPPLPPEPPLPLGRSLTHTPYRPRRPCPLPYSD